MKTKKEHPNARRECERGNALVYVLIAIVLFAALSMTLGRQTDTSEAGTLSDDRAELYATQLISYAAQAKSAIDQMLFTSIDIDELDFMDPSDVDFNSGTQADRIKRVFHPEGGGLIKGRLPDDIVDQISLTPHAGWYIGRFNNVEWTKTTDEDVILVAYQISQQICEKINLKVTGSETIPTFGAPMDSVLIDDSLHPDSNVEFTTDPDGAPICAECHEIASLCVQNGPGNAYSFYTIIADQ